MDSKPINQRCGELFVPHAPQGVRVASSRNKDLDAKHSSAGVCDRVNHKPFIVAIGLIIAAGIVLIMAFG